MHMCIVVTVWLFVSMHITVFVRVCITQITLTLALVVISIYDDNHNRSVPCVLVHTWHCHVNHVGHNRLFMATNVACKSVFSRSTSTTTDFCKK